MPGRRRSKKSPEETRADLEALDYDRARDAAERALSESNAALGALKAEIARLEALPHIDHLFIGTADFKGAWRFWTEVVGLVPEAKWGNPEYAGTVAAAGPTITMAQGQEGPYDELGYNVENGKPVLYMNVKDLEAFHAAVLKRGAKVLRGPLTTHFGSRCFSLEGPDGMVVVFSQRKARGGSL